MSRPSQATPLRQDAVIMLGDGRATDRNWEAEGVAVNAGMAGAEGEAFGQGACPLQTSMAARRISRCAVTRHMA